MPSMIFGDLPIDVARLIFEIIAWDDQNYTISTLSGVSKAVRSWVEPIAYTTLTFESGQHIKRFVPCAEVRVARDPAFFARTVNTLYLLNGSQSPVNTSYILSLCTGVSTLVAWFLWMDTVTDTAPFPAELASMPNLTRLSIHRPITVETSCNLLTHLDCALIPVAQQRAAHLVLLQRFPNLVCISYTHRFRSVSYAWEHAFLIFVGFFQSVLELPLESLGAVILNVNVLTPDLDVFDSKAVAAGVEAIGDERFLVLCSDRRLEGKVKGLITFDGQKHGDDVVPCWVSEIATSIFSEGRSRNASIADEELQVVGR